MKQLCIIRHAKSSWIDPALNDMDRQLEEVGKINAALTGGILKQKGVNPDAIYASSATRAYDTAYFIAETLEFSPQNIIVDPAIYEAQVDVLLSIIQNIPQEYHSIILVGHNPGLTLLANYLADEHMQSLPTCGVCCFEFSTNDWSEITIVESKTLFVTSPHKSAE